MAFKIRIPTKEERKIETLQRLLAEQKQRNDDAESALVELAELYAAQDDAIVELAGLMEEA